MVGLVVEAVKDLAQHLLDLPEPIRKLVLANVIAWQIDLNLLDVFAQKLHRAPQLAGRPTYPANDDGEEAVNDRLQVHFSTHPYKGLTIKSEAMIEGIPGLVGVT